MLPIAAIVEQHGEDTSFLWLQRDNAVRAPHYSLKDLVKLDSRVEAHIDGLRVAGGDGWALALEQLKHPEAGGCFAGVGLAPGRGGKGKSAGGAGRAAGGSTPARDGSGPVLGRAGGGGAG